MDRSGLSHDAKLSAQKIWRVLDTEGKGQLSLDAFVKSLAKLDPNLSTRQTLDRILPLLDKDHRGYVGYDEFVNAYEQMLDEDDEASDTAKDGDGEEEDRDESFDEEETFDREGKVHSRLQIMASLEGLEEKFKEFDEHNKGYLDQSQFHSLFNQHFSSPDTSEEEMNAQIATLWKEMEKDSKGTVTFKELAHALTHDDGARGARPGMIPLASPSGRRPSSSQSSSPLSTSRLLSSVSPIPGRGLPTSLSPTAFLKSSPTPDLPKAESTPRRGRTTQFGYDPQPTVQDPAVQRLMNNLRKHKKRNLNLLEMEAITELSHINALRLVPIELFANIVDQVVEKKQENPDMPIVGKDLGAPSDDKYKEQTRQLNQKNKKLTKKLEQIQKISSTVDHENHELTKKNQDLEDRLKTADRKLEIQSKSFEDQKKQIQSEVSEWKKKHDALIKEHADTVRKLNSASSNEKKQKMTITKLRSMLERIEQSGKSSKVSPSLRQQSMAGTPPTPPQDSGAIDIDKEDTEELKKKLSLMEQDREEHLRLIGSLQGSLKEKSPFKLADDSVSEQMDVVALNAELSKLRQQLKEMSETHTRDIANRDSELQTKLTAIDRLREEIRQLKTQKQPPVERIIEKIVPQQSPADDLLKRKLEANITVLEKSLAEKDSQIARLEKEAEEKLKGKDTQIIRLETELTRVQTSKDSQLHEKVKGKDAQIARLEAEYQEKLQGKDSHISRLEKELLEKVHGKDTQLRKLERELEDKVQAKDSQIAKIERETQEKLQAKDAQIAKLERDVERAHAGKDSQLQEKLQLKELQISRLEKEVEKLQQGGKEPLPRSDSQLARLRKEMERGLGEKDLQILKLEKELERALGEKDLQIVKLQKELEKSVGDKDVYIAKLEREGTNLRRELETQRDSNHSVLEELRVHAIQLEERLSQANAAMQNAIRERQRAEDEANEAWTELRKRREEETYYITYDQKAPSEMLKGGGAMKQFPDSHSSTLLRGETFQPEVSQAHYKAIPVPIHKEDPKPVEVLRSDIIVNLPDSPPPKANLQKGPSHTRVLPSQDPRNQIQDPPWAGGPTAKTPLLASGKRDQDKRCCCCSCTIL